MAGKRRRSGPTHTERPYRCDRSKSIIRNRSALLDTINGFYAAALDLLPVEEMPALVPRLLKAGLCVGFSDPVSNIIVNTVSSYSKPVRGGSSGGKIAATRRRKALSQAVADTGNVKDWPLNRVFLPDMPVATRSLEALVAFLTYYFRYLPACEALEYLHLAKADLLAAVRLVEEDRSSCGGFSYSSRTTKTALRCAALAACHPKPRALVNRSYSLASQMEQVSPLLGTEGGCLSCAAIENISGLLMKPCRKLCGLAGVTPPQFLKENRQPPFVRTKYLKSVLLDKIYGLYLNALAMLPKNDLCMSYHPGLLRAGHCYGPLMDPVSNIVLNTLWYKAMFPPQGELSVVTMMCSRSLVRVACRSLRGLVAYIRTCFSMISKHQAMCYLLFTEANLWRAIQMARREGHAERPMLSQDSAYRAAATEAQHPDPDAVVSFFMSTFPRMPMPTEPFTLDVQHLMQLLFQYCSTPYDSGRVVPVLSDGGSMILSCILEDFKEEERFVCRKVNAMLKKYTQQTKGPEYELHVVCGVNSNVCNSYVFGLHYGPGLFRHRRKIQYSHINFLASPRDSATGLILFFAECCNDEDVINESCCWPVKGSPGRCFLCENEGAKIIHPDLEKYKGCDIDFDQMACSSLTGMAIEGSITDGEFRLHSVDICEEDCIYFDANRDAKCAEFLNARSMKRYRFV